MKKPRDSRYAIGERPVNQRTAKPPAARLPTPALPGLRRQQARWHLGAPLAATLGRPRSAPLPWHAPVGVALGAALLPLAWLSASPWSWVLGAAAALTWGGAAWTWRHHARPAPDPTAVSQADWQALDTWMDAVAGDLPAPLLDQLGRVKQRLVSVTRAMAGAGVDEHLTMDDHFYLQECVRRYLPDSLAHFAQVPRDQRDLPLSDGGDSAHGALARQLDLIDTALQAREQGAARSAGQSLLLQERFLQDKNRD